MTAPDASLPPSLEQVTVAHLEGLGEAHSPLGVMAALLARTLDEGAGSQTAQVAKELRTTLKEVTPDDGGDPFADLMRQLADAPVRDSED